MSRSGYTEDGDNWSFIRWRGVVASSIKGKRGQSLCRDMIAALNALPEKKLYPHELKCRDGVCALGAVGLLRGVDIERLDPENSSTVASTFDIAEPLAREVVFENDEAGPRMETPEGRWRRMRAWAQSQLREPAT